MAAEVPSQLPATPRHPEFAPPVYNRPVLRTVTRVTVWPLSIPMKRPFRHAAAQRAFSTPFILEIELFGGAVGYGETHIRDYVTGERPDELVDTLREVFLPRLMRFRADGLPAAVEQIAALPERDALGRTATGLRAAVELALLDACGRAFGRPITDLAGWFGALPFRSAVGKRPSKSPLAAPPNVPTDTKHGDGARILRSAPDSPLPRYSGVISAEDTRTVRSAILKMRILGLRDFKLKVGDPDDDARLRAAVDALGRSLRTGRNTLRLDANGAWDRGEALDRMKRWAGLPIACVEQPLPRGAEDEWGALAQHTSIPLMADESLVTAQDAQRLFQLGAANAFNIRLAKNGGLLPSIQLAIEARRRGIVYQLGCLVGETSVLSAAGRLFLQMVPGVRFAEGCYGRFLIEGDVVRRPVQIGWGGRVKLPRGPGLGVEVDRARLERYAVTSPIVIVL